MTREALNITMSESLRKAQIRQRLDSLADHTGLTATQIAGRELTIGLGLIESDLRRLFPGQAPTSAALSGFLSLSAALPSAANENEAQLCAAMPSIESQRTAAVSPRPSAVAEPSDPLPRFVSTVDAARVLGYRDPRALIQHSQRHPEIKKLSKKQGRVRLWHLEKLRAEYERQGWQPK